MPALIERIARHRRDLGAAELRVATFLAEQRHRVGHLSAAKIAAEVGVSDATVIRTARALGYAGLGELRERLATELDPARRLAATMARSERSELLGLLDSRVAALGDVGGRLTAKALDSALATLVAADRIVAVGFGPSGFVAGYFAHQCRRIGAATLVVTATGSDLADELLGLRPGDALVLLSYDERSAVVEATLSAAEHLGAPVVLVTDVETSAAVGRADVSLTVGRGEPGEMASHAATIMVLELLAIGIAAADRDRADDSLRRLADVRAHVVRTVD